VSGEHSNFACISQCGISENEHELGGLPPEPQPPSRNRKGRGKEPKTAKSFPLQTFTRYLLKECQIGSQDLVKVLIYGPPLASSQVLHLPQGRGTPRGGIWGVPRTRVHSGVAHR
jgi:hypothetical protein